MKITGYNPTITTGGAVNAQVSASTDVNAYGGKGNGYKAVSAALGKVQQAYEKVSEEEDKRKLMSAMDTYNKGRYDILYNDENGVMNTKLEGAVGSVDNYIERENKLRKEIMGNLKFRTDKYKLAFQDMINKSAEQGFQLVDRHQYKELEAQQDVTLNNNLDNAIMMAQKNYNDADVLEKGVSDIKLLVSARYGDRGEQFVEQVTKNAAAKLGKSVVEEAIMRGDYDIAEKNLKYFDAVFTPEVRDVLEKNLFVKQENESNISLAQSLVNQYGGDIGAIVSELQNTTAFGTDRLMNLAEQRRVLNIAQNINNTNKAIKRANIDKVFNNGMATLKEKRQQGEIKTYVDAMNWASQQAGTDNDQLEALQLAVNISYDRGKKSGFQGLNATDLKTVDEMLRNGAFENEIDYLSYIQKIGGDSDDLTKAQKNYKDFALGTGDYAYKWNEIKKMVMGKTNLTGAEEAMYKGATIMAGADIAKFITTEKRQPLDTEVVEMVQKNMGKAYIGRYNLGITGWDRLEASNAELALAGIRSAVQQGEDLYRVDYLNGRAMFMNTERLQSELEKAMRVANNGR